jgi:hypothetical protein
MRNAQAMRATIATASDSLGVMRIASCVDGLTAVS